MRRSRHGVPVLARLSLLLAAACYIAVVTLGPSRHLEIQLASEQAPAGVHTPATSGAQHHPTHAPTHDERTCPLYHCLAATAIPAAAAVVPPVVGVAAEATTEVAPEPRSGILLPSRARSPPAAFV
jgi:hypothetical protein